MMPKNIARALLCVFSVTPNLLAQGADSETDFFSSPYETASSTETTRKFPGPYVKMLSKMIDWPIELLEKLEKRGFGRTEMISFVVVARKSMKSWDDLIKEREKGVTLRQMAETVGLQYNNLFRDSQRIKSDVERSMKENPVATEPVEKSTTTPVQQPTLKTIP